MLKHLVSDSISLTYKNAIQCQAIFIECYCTPLCTKKNILGVVTQSTFR